MDGDVSIEVYNLQGRLVESLVNRHLEAGYHSVVWNADNHASGMYFVQMVSGEYMNIQKLMLVK
jgi:flagellar hook assembly protein FlgD